MAWLFLILAGLFEVGWAIGLKYSEGFSRPVPTAWTIGSMILSISLLGLALRGLPLSTGYAVWTGIGTVGTVLAGFALFGESLNPPKLLCILLIVAGIAGLKLTQQ